MVQRRRSLIEFTERTGKVLNDSLVGYNQRRPRQGRNMNGHHPQGPSSTACLKTTGRRRSKTSQTSRLTLTAQSATVSRSPFLYSLLDRAPRLPGIGDVPGARSCPAIQDATAELKFSWLANHSSVKLRVRFAEPTRFPMRHPTHIFSIGRYAVALLFILCRPVGAQNEAHVFVDTIWRASPINVCWENTSNYYAQERVWVQEAISRTWEAHSGVRFAGWGACRNNGSEVRIAVADSAAQAPHVKRLGAGLAGVPSGVVLNFEFQNWSPDCRRRREECIQTIAAHEFGHVLGFAHEQGRHDTPASCTQRQRNEPTGGLAFGPWDPNSIMNYCNRVWSNGGQLSAGDTAAVQYFYRPPDNVTPSGVGIFFAADNFLNIYFSSGNSVRLGPPIWGGPTSVASVGGTVYVVQNSVLHRVNPRDGLFTAFPAFKLDPNLPIAGNKRFLFYFLSGRLWRMDVSSGENIALGNADWSSGGGVSSISATEEEVFIVQSGQLHKVSLHNGDYIKLNDPVWNGETVMASDGETLFIIQNGALHRVDPNTGSYQTFGEFVWRGATGLTVLSSQLYIMQNGSLHSVNKNTGAYLWIKEKYWSTSGNITAVQ